MARSRRTLRLACSLSLSLAIATFNHRARAADELVPPALSSEVTLSYPPGASGAALVTIELTLDRDGTVTDAKVTSTPNGAFDAAALEAARKLRFSPARKNGAPVAAVIPFTFTFAPPPSAPSPLPAAANDAGAAPVPETPALSATPAPPPGGPLDQTEVLELDVKGERAPRETTKHELTREEVRTVPGTGGDVLRAVETMPGVARPPGLGPDIVVRGAAPQDTLVFVGGIWIPSAYHFGGVRTVLPAELLERFDFYPGNFGPQYGRAMGGVIDVAVRSPRRDRVGGIAQLDLLDGRLLAEGPLGEKTRFLVAGRRSWVDAWIVPILRDGGSNVRTAPVYWDYQAMVEHDLSSRTTARVLWFGSDDRMAFIIEAPNASDPLFSGSFASKQSFQRLEARVDTRLDGGGRFTNMIAWGPQKEGFTAGDQYVDARYHFLTARSDVRVPVTKHVALGGGLDLFGVTYDVTLRLTPYPAADEVAGPYFARPPRRVASDGFVARPAAYALAEVRPTERMLIMPSARVDYSGDTKAATIDPRIGARWDLTEGFPRTTAKSALGVFHQPPQPVESIAPFGTPGIGSNRAIHASAGFEQELARGVELSVEGYAKKLDALVVSRADESSAIGARFVNTGEGRVLGGELLLKAKVGRFSGWVAYSLSRSERRNAPSEPLRLTAWDQPHVLSTVGSFDLGKGYTLGARFRAISGAPFTPYRGGVLDADAGAYAAVPGPRFSERMPPFIQLDVRFEKAWRVGKSSRISAYLDLQNATNQKNPEGLVYRYDYAKRDVAAGLPILPILGIRGEL